MASKKRKKKTLRGKTRFEVKHELLIRKGKEFAENLRKNSTKWEKLVYVYLKDLHYKFRFQEPIITKNNHLYITDFLLDESNLCIEIDGKQHYTPENKRKDNLRTKRLKREGYHVLRLTNSFVSIMTKSQFNQIIQDRIKMLKKLRSID